MSQHDSIFKCCWCSNSSCIVSMFQTRVQQFKHHHSWCLIATQLTSFTYTLSLLFFMGQRAERQDLWGCLFGFSVISTTVHQCKFLYEIKLIFQLVSLLCVCFLPELRLKLVWAHWPQANLARERRTVWRAFGGNREGKSAGCSQLEEVKMQHTLIHGSASLNKCAITTMLWVQTGSCTQEIWHAMGTCTNAGISVYPLVASQMICCQKMRREKRTGKAWPVLCALTSTFTPTSVGPVATLSVSRVFVPSLTTDPWTLPAHCVEPWSHTPTSTKVNVWQKWDFL